jgi:sugar O-acyltransferase (sialic acid O-acetyltransferase NeuD family)
MKRLVIIGAGGHGRAVAEIVLATRQYQLAGFLDDASPRLGRLWDLPVFGPTSAIEECRTQADAVIVAIGNNRVRENAHVSLRRAGFEIATVIHPRAIVSARAMVGCGCTIMMGALVGTEAELGEGVILNTGAVVDHHCRVEDFGHVGTNASMAGGSVLGRGAWMQAGSALGYGVRIPAGGVLDPGQGLSSSPKTA